MLETIKLVMLLRLIPTEVAAVRAVGGITSERTTHVTGPVPSPKKKMKVMIDTAERAGRSALRPIARVVRETVSSSLQKVRSLREPVRWGSVNVILEWG